MATIQAHMVLSIRDGKPDVLLFSSEEKAQIQYKRLSERAQAWENWTVYLYALTLELTANRA